MTIITHHRNPWTESDIENLITLKDSKKTFAQIAKIMGRTEGAVTTKYHYLRKEIGKKSRIWTHEETEDLIALAETLPRTKLYFTYNKLARKKGYQERTIAALDRKLFELGQSTKPQSGWYSVTAISIGLGFTQFRVHSWIKNGLKHHAEGKHCFYVRNDHLVAYILDHPNCLSGISDEGLRWFVSLLKEEKEMRGHDGRPEHARSLNA